MVATIEGFHYIVQPPIVVTLVAIIGEQSLVLYGGVSSCQWWGFCCVWKFHCNLYFPCPPDYAGVSFPHAP